MKTLRIAIYTALASMVALSACKKGDVNNPSTNYKNGIEIKMTDAPGDYAMLNVEVERVDIYSETSGWVTVSNESQVVNVLSLTNGNSITLASHSNIETGLYTQVALYFGDDNELMVNDGGETTSFDLSAQGAVIININQEVDANTQAEVLLDFDVAESIHINSSGSGSATVTLDPAIHFIEDAETGVSGHVEGNLFAAIHITDGENSFSTFTDANGNFMLQGLESGNYTLVVVLEGEGTGTGSGGINVDGILGVVVSDDGINAGALTEVTVDNVSIVDGQITQLGTIEIQ